MLTRMHIPQELRIRSRGTDAQFLRNMQPTIYAITNPPTILYLVVLL